MSGAARKRTPNSFVASAALMTTSKATAIKSEAWQGRAWDYYDEVGELRFGVGWLANALSRVNLVAAIAPTNPGDEPAPIDVEKNPGMAEAVRLVEQIAGGVAGHGALLGSCAKQLTVPGLGYILASVEDETDSFNVWRVLSNEEVRSQNGDIQFRDSEDGSWQPLAVSDLLMKIWRPHPRKSWEPDSPIRAVLGTLREIDLLSKRIDADAESRLAGAGLLIVPTEAEFPPNQTAVEIAAEDENGVPKSADDIFIETLVTVMTIPIQDRESAAAVVPLVIRVPGEHADKVRHLTFSTPFDQKLDILREAAVKRLALGLDMPPEVLLGLGDTNHWSAWQINEEAITLQVEPMAEIICHALTVYYLRPSLQTAGFADPKSVVVWYDTTDLTTRPDRGPAAQDAFDRVEISRAAYLRERGLEADDAPSEDERRERTLLAWAERNPQAAGPVYAALGYLDKLGLDVIDVSPPPAEPPALPQADDERTIPERTDDEPTGDMPEDEATASALLAACDGIVARAVERAGQRLRTDGRRTGNLDPDTDGDVMEVHVRLDASACTGNLDNLLTGAWSRVPEIAGRYNVAPDLLQASLHRYTRALLAARVPHEYGRLGEALGIRVLAHA